MNHWRAFDKKFFIKHQDTLLFLLNAPVVSYVFRYIFRIHEKRDIAGILPNAYFTVDGEQITADFRTHDKYSKRLYYAFRPLWWALHAWDWTVADRFVPALSFGFATLTSYPDADPETTTVDGTVKMEYVYSSGVGWSTLRADAGSGADDDTATRDIVSILTDDVGWQRLRRGIFLFDTSTLTSSATISAAVLSLYGYAKTDGLSITPDIDIYTSNPASNTALVGGDFDSLGSTSQTGTPITYAGWNTAAYNAFTFNTYANISKTGVSKFGARNAYYDATGNDLTAYWANTASSTISCYMADQSGTSNDPRFVVTYTLPSSAWVPSGRLVFESSGN